MKTKNMLFKKVSIKFVLLLSIIQGLVTTFGTATYCSLDSMRMFAMQACEHLFEFEDSPTRETRSLFHGHNQHMKNENYDTSRYRSDNRNHICRSIYPPGGYLKVSFEHYQKLTRLDVFPKYKAKQTLQREKKRRHKRDDNTYYNGNNDNNNNNNDNSNNNNNIESIIYCCYHKCDEEFFC
uniref:Uncharacterized protein n=1 Tax=Glossina pallidipes TaxID=7398 RepID=A0A1A9Z2P2_GLOPL